RAGGEGSAEDEQRVHRGRQEARRRTVPEGGDRRGAEVEVRARKARWPADHGLAQGEHSVFADGRRLKRGRRIKDVMRWNSLFSRSGSRWAFSRGRWPSPSWEWVLRASWSRSSDRSCFGAPT